MHVAGLMGSKYACVLLAANLLFGCSSTEKSASATQDDKGTAGKSKSQDEQPSARDQLETYRALLGESARAELEVEGLRIDFGTGDQHKYTYGGWKTGWGDSKRADTTFAPVEDRSAKLKIAPRAEVAEIVIRARSASAGQQLTLRSDGKVLGRIDIPGEWGVQRIPGPIEPGRHDLLLSFSKSGSPTAEIDWMWLATTAGGKATAPVPRVLPINVGDESQRSLTAPSARSYSFYLEPPPHASLVFDYGSRVKTEFVVRAETDDGKVTDLFTGTSNGKWTEARADLAAYAGKPIRLELSTRGPAGPAGWAEPEIMVEPTEAAAQPEIAASRKPQNVILILMDTNRYDAFAAFAPDNKVKTPTYDAWAKRSTVFQTAYDNENWTKPSVATVLTGLYPTTHDTKTDSAELPAEIELISQHLDDQGYSTAGFIANGYISDKFGFKKGWNTYRNYIREEKPSDAAHVYGDAIEWLDEHQKERFFLYIQSIDPHVPYRVGREYSKLYFPEEYDGWLGDSVLAKEQVAISKKKHKVSTRDIDWLKALYWGEVTFQDEHMGDFLAEVEKLGLLDNTLIVITNDHGEELYEHGRLGHGHSLYEPMIRAPLLMHFPGMFPAGKRVPEVVENVDIVPTILDALGVAPIKDAEGLSLVSLVAGKPHQRPYYAITEFLDGSRSLRVGDYKLMIGNLSGLYNVVEDSNEDHNIRSETPIALRLCEVYLGEGLANPDKKQRLLDLTTRRRFKAGKAKVTPEVRKQLEALGYFGDDGG